MSIGALYTKYNVYESLPATLCAVILNGAVERPVSVFATTTSITAIGKHQETNHVYLFIYLI